MKKRTQIRQKLLQFARRMCLMYKFQGKHQEPHPYHVKSSWKPPIQQSVGQESYLEEVKSDLEYWGCPKLAFLPICHVQDPVLRYLHFAENTLTPAADSEGYNKLYKIQPFLDLVVARFQEVYTPERQLAIDETLIKFKGKLHFRQFIPIKPSRFGIKASNLVVVMSWTARFTLGRSAMKCRGI